MSGAFTDQGLIASIIAAAIATAGLMSMAAAGNWGKRNSPYISAFAVGMLVVAVLFHLIPEAISESPNAWQWVLIGFVFLSLTSALLAFVSSAHHETADPVLGYASMFAIGVHAFMDGFVYEAAFRDYGPAHDNIFTGVLTGAALMLHKYPEGIIAFFLSREAGRGKLAAGLWAFAVAALPTPGGAIFGDYVFSVLGHNGPPVMLGLTSGALIYLLVFHLAPDAAHTPHRRGYAVAAFGVIVGLLAVIVHALGAPM